MTQRYAYLDKSPCLDRESGQENEGLGLAHVRFGGSARPDADSAMRAHAQASLSAFRRLSPRPNPGSRAFFRKKTGKGSGQGANAQVFAIEEK